MLRRLGALRLAAPWKARALCSSLASAAPTAAPVPPRVLYHFHYVRHLRQLLRMKVLQLGAGVGVLVPVVSVLGSGGALSGGEVGLMGGIVAGTVAVGASMSWYCERFVGEICWLPAARALRVSTLNVWGNRTDRDIPLAQLAPLLAPSFVPSEDVKHTARREG